MVGKLRRAKHEYSARPPTPLLYPGEFLRPFALCSLMGTGVRVKKIGPAGVKVYAVGLYVDEKGAMKELDAHK